jgi:hypothetical protein
LGLLDADKEHGLGFAGLSNLTFASRKLAGEIATREMACDSNNETQSGISQPQR